MIDPSTVYKKIENKEFNLITLNDIRALVATFPFYSADTIKKLILTYNLRHQKRCSDCKAKSNELTSINVNNVVKDLCEDCYIDWYYGI